MAQVVAMLQGNLELPLMKKKSFSGNSNGSEEYLQLHASGSKSA